MKHATIRTLAKAGSLTILLIAVVACAVGCSENSPGNPVSPITNPLAIDVNGTHADSYRTATGSTLDNDVEEYCEVQLIAFATVRNDLRCEAAVVEVDGDYLTTLEPLSAVDIFLKAGKHKIVFSRIKGSRVIQQILLDLEPCEVAEFSTGTDFCAEPQK